eukprot:m.174273 g.174273  ORF g.174273 m.174273 type:complete len:191 (+) comp16751_c0_seq17:2779-3351(+)
MALHRALILFSTLEVTLLAQSVPRLVASLEAVSKLTSPNFLLQVIDVNRDAEVKVRETILGDLRRELATVVVYCLGDAALAVQDVQAVFEVFGSVVIVDQQLADSATLVTFETIEAAEKAIRAEHVEVDGMPVKVSCFQLKSCFAAPCMKADVPYEHALLVCVSTACCRVLSIEAGASRASSHSPVSTSR